MSKPQKGRSAGRIQVPDEMWHKISWCHDNNIGVSIMPDWNSARDWIIEIRINDSRHKDPNRYKSEDALAKMYEYYEYYYNKYND